MPLYLFGLFLIPGYRGESFLKHAFFSFYFRGRTCVWKARDFEHIAVVGEKEKKKKKERICM